MKLPALDSIWKPTYRYVVILPSDSTMGFYFRLVELLTEGKSYTRDNTFIICRNEDREIIEKNLPGYSIFSESLTLKRQSIFYSVKRKEDNWYILKGEKRWHLIIILSMRLIEYYGRNRMIWSSTRRNLYLNITKHWELNCPQKLDKKLLECTSISRSFAYRF